MVRGNRWIRVARSGLVTGVVLLATVARAGAAAAAETPLRDAVAAVRAETFAPPHVPSTHERVDITLGVISLSASAVAIGLTGACVSEGTCREVNPVMRKWLGDSQAAALLGKAAIGGAVHYAVYHLMPRSKGRTVALGVLAGLNLFDAGNDIRVMRRIDTRRPAH